MSAAPLLCPGIEGRSGRNTGPGDTCSSRGLMRGHVRCARGPRAGRISAGSVRGLWQVTPWRLHGCVGWAATGTASSGVDQTVSGPCGEEGTGRALRPARRSPSGVPEQLPLSKEKQVLNIRKPVSCSLPVWEPGVSRGRSVYVSGAARSCEAGLFFPAGRRFASAPPTPPGRRCLDFHLESLAQVPSVRDGLSPRTQSPFTSESLLGSTLHLPCGLRPCPVIEEGDQGQQ